jgi:hypothetical protein
MEQTMYTKKGKATGKNVLEVVSVEEKGKETHFNVHQKSLNKKGKVTYEGDLTYKCVDDTFYIDMSTFINSEQMGANGEMDVSMTMDQVDIPVNAHPGQELKDGSMEMKMSSGVMNMNMTISIVDRKVEAVEPITTPAGTFDCVKISQNIVTKMMMTFTTRTVDWYAAGVGVVRSETYDKKGKLSGYTELTALTKP